MKRNCEIANKISITISLKVAFVKEENITLSIFNQTFNFFLFDYN